MTLSNREIATYDAVRTSLPRIAIALEKILHELAIVNDNLELISTATDKKEVA